MRKRGTRLSAAGSRPVRAASARQRRAPPGGRCSRTRRRRRADAGIGPVDVVEADDEVVERRKPLEQVAQRAMRAMAVGDRGAEARQPLRVRQPEPLDAALAQLGQVAVERVGPQRVGQVGLVLRRARREHRAPRGGGTLSTSWGPAAATCRSPARPRAPRPFRRGRPSACSTRRQSPRARGCARRGARARPLRQVGLELRRARRQARCGRVRRRREVRSSRDLPMPGSPSTHDDARAAAHRSAAAAPRARAARPTSAGGASTPEILARASDR